ncbi:hypothetical protein ACWDKQ_00685 [Saccharopolyspora sp. NPDC000995]
MAVSAMPRTPPIVRSHPWYIVDGICVATARDFTHDPAAGLDIDRITDELAASRDPRIKYRERYFWWRCWGMTTSLANHNGSRPRKKSGPAHSGPARRRLHRPGPPESGILKLDTDIKKPATKDR